MLKKCSIWLLSALILLLPLTLAGCGQENEVYFLNFKPEAAKAY